MHVWIQYRPTVLSSPPLTTTGTNKEITLLSPCNRTTSSVTSVLHVELVPPLSRLEVVELLLGRGADAHVLTDEGETSHQQSMRNGYHMVADILKEHGVGGEKRTRFDENVLTF